MAGSTDLETVQRLSVGDDHCRLMKVFVQGASLSENARFRSVLGVMRQSLDESSWLRSLRA